MTDDPAVDGLRAAALRRLRVRVNQVGYLPAAAKRATVVTRAEHALPFTVRTVDGSAVLDGVTSPCPPDPSSGFAVHVADLTALGPHPEPLRVQVAELTSHPFRVAADVYDRLLGDALRFFYAQRSGTPIDDDVLPGYGRPAGHVGIAPNQGDTAVRGWRGPAAERLYPGWRLDRALDVSGGWYDAGDHGKYVTSGALPAAQLLAAHARRLPRDVPRASGARRAGPSLLDEALWQVDWILRMQVPPGEQHAGLAFHRVHDEVWTPLPMAPHDDPAPRSLHRPSTAAALDLAAVAAHASTLVDDPGRAAALLAAARTAYAAAGREPLLLAPDDEGAHGGGPYNDAVITDERYWAACELFLAGDASARADVLSSPCHDADVFDPDGFDADRVAAWARLRLATCPSDLPDRDRVRGSVLEAAERLVAVAATQPWGQPYAPRDGWDWGSTGRILNNAVVLATAYDLGGRRAHRDTALAGLDFVLGRNAVGLSFVTGHGCDTSHRQRVRHFGHALDPACPPPPPGSLAGGPASKTFPGFPGDPRFAGLPPQLCYVDEPTSETTNDVCVRWNGALVWVAAWAVEQSAR